MAKRPVYVPIKDGTLGVKEIEVDFEWFPGLSKSQKQKSITSLHESANNQGIDPILEVSSKSLIKTGVDLSAFNLCIVTKKKKRTLTVESAFQGSKVFEFGGPYKDLLEKPSIESKKDPRIKESGALKNFEFYGEEFDLKPRTLFYDWLYLNALNQNKVLSNEVTKYNAFTDIEFNKEKSINCQAFSAALFVSLVTSELLREALVSRTKFEELLNDLYQSQNNRLDIQESFI